MLPSSKDRRAGRWFSKVANTHGIRYRIETTQNPTIIEEFKLKMGLAYPFLLLLDYLLMSRANPICYWAN